ncbi:heparan-alpha-glucosaminide N-acetyltransferase domain-containing protein [Demequina iriomotensis]|uniref:heparan-alpha-glucosaminide N-acetyltransferase domain-containing protein n=1 Tax=Demequina iriomotensis TaxID=1536641 RepID=UPI00078569D8|nr:heparan-alpha-glucosaminide N-acetyltransferase domain-containing protein [Demequina iriomotensis]
MSTRIIGLDVARGFAVLGMVAAHVGDDGTRGADADGWGWLLLAHGRPSALFAVLAGVTMTLMLVGAGGRHDAAAVRRTRARVAARAGVLIVLGLLLTQLATGVDIVLVNLGLIMLMAIPLLRAPTWVLLSAGGVAFAVGRVLVAALQPEGWWSAAPVVGRLWSYHYPAMSWIGYALIGLALGCVALRSTRTQVALLGAGVSVAAIAVAVRVLAGEGPITDLGAHTYTPLEMVANTAVAAGTIGACCWLAPRARPLLSPIEALGSMALTGYVAHLLVIAAVGSTMVYEPSNVALVALEAALLASAWAWRRWQGQGPLERGLTRVSNAAGDRADRRVSQAAAS